jgi:rSAM/selenodomain-associated transferase 1
MADDLSTGSSRIGVANDPSAGGSGIGPARDPLGEQSLILIQLARWPVAGKVKTRLIPELGEQGALQAHVMLSQTTLDTLLAAKLGAVWLLWDSQPCSADHCGGLLVDGSVEQGIQQGDGLGDRMQHALQSALQYAPKALLVGSDCPGLSPAYLRQASALLDNHCVVLGPAEDGGYVLIGVNRSLQNLAVLFAGIPWGTGQVLEKTLAGLQYSGIRYGLLPALWDVDVFADYCRFQAQKNRTQVRE